MRPDQVTAWISDARFDAYLRAADHDHKRAVALYNWNAEVSAAFMEELYHLEVLFRNAIDRQFAAGPTDQALSLEGPDVWLCDPQLLTEETLQRVAEAIERLTRESKPPTRGRVVASLSFGFWCSLFSGRYENLWRSHLRHAFPNGDGRRKQVNDLATPILHFRNRVAHHEAIFSSDLKKKHQRQLQLAGLVDEEAQRYIAALSRVEKLLLEKP